MSYQHLVESRRRFLQNVLGVSAAGLLPAILDMQKWAAAAPLADYRALVCVFLYGGNDSANTVVPRSGAQQQVYAQERGPFAIAPGSLLPIAPASAQPLALGLHPNLAELQALFQQRKLAIVNNVGPLLAPTTKAQYDAESVPLPPNLFAHDEQQEQWMTSLPSGPQTGKRGWGGRIADLLHSLNGNSQVSLSIALDGSTNLFQVGRVVVPFQTYPGVLPRLLGMESWQLTMASAITQIINQARTNVLEQQWNTSLKRAVDVTNVLSAALDATPPLATVFPTQNGLADQLKMAARMISASGALGLKRQIFFVALGGFDTHGGQLADHPRLLRLVSQALAAFYNATVELGVANRVTTFTASDFGRTLKHNGEGTDHGWGGHHFVMGDAVRGGDMYGTYPTVAVNGPDDVGEGRWLPTIAIDEYAATLAKWFGVSATDIPLVVPNIGRFARRDLGFLL